ncbi:hypothetical protein Sjap_000284 [Stephania japonica]|uniref:F-box domain-containing protein n=1 Tax=Stephania japonica TaxID=461633 RepID=A0AAP0KJX7_9MAGN
MGTLEDRRRAGGCYCGIIQKIESILANVNLPLKKKQPPPPPRPLSLPSPLESTKKPPLTQLPNDVILEILAKLPTKSLSRFKCVDKTWLGLINSSKFAEVHVILNQNSSNSCPSEDDFLVITRRETLFTMPLLWNVADNNVEDPVEMDYPFKSPYNSAMEYIVLPKHLTTLRYYSRRLIGFGYDSTIDDYKVITVSEQGYPLIERKAYMYIPRNNTWRSISQAPPQTEINFNNKGVGVFANGAIHWLGSIPGNNGNGRSLQPRLLFYFDLASEEWGKIEVPDPEERTAVWVKVGVTSRGELAVYQSYSKMRDKNPWTNSFETQLYVLKKKKNERGYCGCSWSREGILSSVEYERIHNYYNSLLRWTSSEGLEYRRSLVSPKALVQVPPQNSLHDDQSCNI